MTDLTERAATVRYLRRNLQDRLARGIERGAHLRPDGMGRRSKDCYPCGHERTEDNSVRVGVGNGVRCKICRRAIGAAYRKRQRADDDATDR